MVTITWAGSGQYDIGKVAKYFQGPDHNEVRGGDGPRRWMFSCPIAWTVRGHTTAGYIVQFIERNEKWTQKVDHFDEPLPKDRQRLNVAANTYWEAWHVRQGSSTAEPMSNGINDNFSVGRDAYGFYHYTPPRTQVRMPSKDFSEGTWKIRGTIYWVAATGFHEAGWSRFYTPVDGDPTGSLTAVPEAGKLLSRYLRPTQGDGLAPTGQLVYVTKREYAGKYNFTKTPNTHVPRHFPISFNNMFTSRTNGLEV